MSMNNDKLIELLEMLIKANQADVIDNESMHGEEQSDWVAEDHAYYQGKIAAYKTILEYVEALS